jgi:hypothetical protein
MELWSVGVVGGISDEQVWPQRTHRAQRFATEADRHAREKCQTATMDRSEIF